jgi:hypothetical protein
MSVHPTPNLLQGVLGMLGEEVRGKSECPGSAGRPKELRPTKRNHRTVTKEPQIQRNLCGLCGLRFKKILSHPKDRSLLAGFAEQTEKKDEQNWVVYAKVRASRLIASVNFPELLDPPPRNLTFKEFTRWPTWN